MARSRLLVINSASNIAIRLSGNLLGLFTLPLFIGYFSESLYGVFILATGLTESLSMFDFGVNNALTRFTAEYTADHDRERYSTALAGNVIVAGLLGLVFAGVVFVLSFYADKVFHVEADQVAITRTAFRLAAGYTFVFVLAKTTQSILEGHELFYWRNISQIPVILVTLGLFFVVKYRGMAFTTFVLVTMIGRLIPGVLNLVVILRKRLLRGLTLSSGWSWSLLRSEFIRYSANLFLLQLFAFCAFMTDKFVIGTIMSTAFVAIFGAVSKPMYIIRMVSNQSLLVLGPMFARIGRKGNEALINTILYRGNLLHSLLIYPPIAALIVLMQPFMDLWIPKFSPYAYWGSVAGLVFVFAPLHGFLTRLLTYSDHVNVVRNISFWTVLLNLAVSIAGTFIFGIGGVVLGSIAQMAIQVPIYLVVAKRIRGLRARDMYPRDMFIHAGFVAAVACGLYVLTRYVYTLNSWPRFILVLSVSMVVLYSLGAYILWKKRLLSVPQTGPQDDVAPGAA